MLGELEVPNVFLESLFRLAFEAKLLDQVCNALLVISLFMLQLYQRFLSFLEDALHASYFAEQALANLGSQLDIRGCAFAVVGLVDAGQFIGTMTGCHHHHVAGCNTTGAVRGLKQIGTGTSNRSSEQ